MSSPQTQSFPRSLFKRAAENKVALLSAVLVLVALALVTHQYWLFPGGTLPSPSRDLKSNLLPIMMYRDQIASAEFPLTSPWYSEPSNFSNPLWNFFYFPATLFFLILPVVGAVRVVVLLHILLGWFFMQLLLKEFTQRNISAYFGGFLYVLSGLWVAKLTSYHLEKIFGLALVPLILFAFRRSYDRATWPYALLLGAALAGLVYAGATYLLIFTLLMLALSALLLFIQVRPTRGQLQTLLLGAIIFLLLAAPKLIPNYLAGVGSPRPDAHLATTLDIITTYILPGDIWLLALPEVDLWRWNETTIFVSTAGLVLAVVGIVNMARGRDRRWLLPLLATTALMIYWSLGFPPFGLSPPLSQLRVASRALMLPGVIACLLAGVGFDALLTKRLHFPIWGWAFVIVGFALELVYMSVRGQPEYLNRIIDFTLNAALNRSDRQLLRNLLWIQQWQVVEGWLIALILVVLFLAIVYLTRKGKDLSAAALILAAVALFSTASAMAANTVKLESDPLQDPALMRMRQDVGNGKVAVAANIFEKDIRGRIEFALAGNAHLINPYYGSFGQDVKPKDRSAIDYVVSSQPLNWDVAIMRLWSPHGVLTVVPRCALVLDGHYGTQDPLTRNDLPQVRNRSQLRKMENARQELFLYRVIRSRCR